jgi:hypothetical protein
LMKENHMMEAITNRLASVAGLVAYVSVVVFPTLLLLFALSLDLLPTDRRCCRTHLLR